MKVTEDIDAPFLKLMFKLALHLPFRYVPLVSDRQRSQIAAIQRSVQVIIVLS